MPERVESVLLFTPQQEARAAATLAEIIDRPVRERSKELAQQREAYCRELLEARIPRRLHWLIDHPRLLKQVLRVVKRWEPMLTIVNLSKLYGLGESWPSVATTVQTWKGIWEDEMRAKGKQVPRDGLVFAYTDPFGLPAEVYG